MASWLFPALAALVTLLPAVGGAEREPRTDGWPAVIERTVPAVVALRVAATRPFDTEGASVSSATGFVVDAERGLILTNRHVVMPGPVTAEAVFLNHEQVDVYPLYRDPVHDFGFYRYDPASVKFIRPRAIELAPEGARVGREIRILGNDAGEKLSILAGTLARLDRAAPIYGRNGYNDFNTFYLQAASGTSGGSSGSPVIDRQGRAIALNAGANRRAASSFFLPLPRIVRALERLRSGQPVTRGSLQTVFTYESYDELRRLGLSGAREAWARQRFPEGSGLLVVRRSVVDSPAREYLEPGDIVLEVSGSPIGDFESLEALLDDSVGETVNLRISRGGEEIEAALPVFDLHALSPSEYLEFGGGIVHPLSYQQALNFGVPTGGMYVASDGYALSRGEVPPRSVITEVSGRKVTSLDELESALAEAHDGERISIRSFAVSTPRSPQVNLVPVDRRWFPMSRCRRDDTSGGWPCIESSVAPKPPLPSTSSTDYAPSGPRPAKRLARSLVFVEFDIPYKTDGAQGASFSGAGLVVDAERGLVLVDRDTVPTALGDLSLTFARSLTIAAEVLALHPEHNLTLLRYDPSSLGDTPVRSAKLVSKSFESGDKIWQVGLTSQQQLVSRHTQIDRLQAVRLPIPNPPRFRESNLELISLTDMAPSVGGVLCDRRGRVHALWSSFSTERRGKADSFFGGIPVEVATEMLDAFSEGRPFVWRTLGAELDSISLAEARDRGVPADEARKLEKHDSRRRQVLTVRRLSADSPAASRLRSGDLILAMNGEPVTSFRDVERASQASQVSVRVLRDEVVSEFELETLSLSGQGTDRALVWGGALLQQPPRVLASQRGLTLEGIYVAARWRGSPSERHGLQPTRRIVSVNGRPTPSLDAFLEAVEAVGDRESVRLRTLDLDGQPRLRTLELDLRFWPTFELTRDRGSWQRFARHPKSGTLPALVPVEIQSSPASAP